MGVLYGARATSLTASDLYTIDPATAAATSVGPTGFAITGLVFDPTDGTLYGATSANSASDPFSLITIDPDTGDGTLVGAFSIDGVTDLACSDAGQLYASGVSGQYFSVNKTTAVQTSIHGAGFLLGGGLAFDPSGVLWNPYESDQDLLFFTNVVTGTLDTAGVLTGYQSGAALKFMCAASDSDGLLWCGLNLGTGTPRNVSLVTIDTATQTTSLVAATITGLDSLAWSLPAVAADLPAVFDVAFDAATLEANPTWTSL